MYVGKVYIDPYVAVSVTVVTVLLILAFWSLCKRDRMWALWREKHSEHRYLWGEYRNLKAEAHRYGDKAYAEENPRWKELAERNLHEAAEVLKEVKQLEKEIDELEKKLGIN